MTAREIDAAAARLRELRLQAIGDLALAATTFALALVASRLGPDFAAPLLVGAMTMTVLGLRAFVQRTFLVEDLALDADAYAVQDVRRYAARAVSLAHRRCLARSLRARVDEPASAGELLALIAVLEDGEHPVDSRAVVSLEHALDEGAPIEDLHARLRNVAGA